MTTPFAEVCVNISNIFCIGTSQDLCFLKFFFCRCIIFSAILVSVSVSHFKCIIFFQNWIQSQCFLIYIIYWFVPLTNLYKKFESLVFKEIWPVCCSQIFVISQEQGCSLLDQNGATCVYYNWITSSRNLKKMLQDFPLPKVHPRSCWNILPYRTHFKASGSYSYTVLLPLLPPVITNLTLVNKSTISDMHLRGRKCVQELSLLLLLLILFMICFKLVGALFS